MEKRQSFRVIIAGTRHFNDYKMLSAYCDKVLSNKAQTHEIIVLSGHCYGTDLLGERYARERKYSCEIYAAEWSKFGLSAGHRRNRQMAEVADALIAFWDGESRGTKGMIEIAEGKGLMIRVKLYTQ